MGNFETTITVSYFWVHSIPKSFFQFLPDFKFREFIPYFILSCPTDPLAQNRALKSLIFGSQCSNLLRKANNQNESLKSFEAYSMWRSQHIFWRICDKFFSFHKIWIWSIWWWHFDFGHLLLAYAIGFVATNTHVRNRIAVWIWRFRQSPNIINS